MDPNTQPRRSIPPARPKVHRIARIADNAPCPDPAGSVVFLVGLLLTGLFLQGSMPSAVARFAAIGTGVSLAASIFLDARHGLRNLVRADLLALVSLYYLSFFEFLFPQPNFITMVDLPSTFRGVTACLYGYAGLVIGRHLLRTRRQPFKELLTTPVSTALILTLLIVSFCIGFSYMLACSNYNPMLMVWWFLEPRFSQPWSRMALGDAKAMFHELEMCLFLVPPLAGVILARRKRYSILSLLVTVFASGFVLFYRFCNGTRYYVAAYLITMLAGFAFAASAKQFKEVIIAAISAGAIMLISTVLMLEFRNIGLHDFLANKHQKYERTDEPEQTLLVDFNLYVICRITDTFPRQRPYLGWEIPYLAIIRPVPRALWPAKPQGMSFPIEDVIGARGWTVAATFVGEAYMAGGCLWVFMVACGLGMLARWWNLLASPRNSEFGVLVYSSGFFAAAIAMRSILVLSTGAAAIGAHHRRRISPHSSQLATPATPCAGQASCAHKVLTR